MGSPLVKPSEDFLTLIVGHYVLQEWSPVNELVIYIVLGLACLVLPAHASWRLHGG